ncbi:MAG TPA: hypothetical protein VEV81_11090 [Pyrinomonadaceae bacterium]|nr:hypothetical protein [Pyrinomonadaceae bacterium]
MREGRFLLITIHYFYATLDRAGRVRDGRLTVERTCKASAVAPFRVHGVCFPGLSEWNAFSIIKWDGNFLQ